MTSLSADTLRVASVPMFNLHGVEEACTYIVEKIHVAAQMGAEVVVFPETATNAYQPTAQEDRAAIEAWMPRILEAVKRAAGPWVVLGTYTFDAEEHHNSALVIDPAGVVRGTYHKIGQGGTRWLMMEILGARCTVLICSDLWVPGIFTIPKMLGAQVCFYPHASGRVAEDRADWSALYYTRAWENRMFLVMADCSWVDGAPFERPATVPYPYDFTYHQLNQSCIIDPVPRYLARAMRDEENGLLIADIDPERTKEPMDPRKYTIGKPWLDMLDSYQNNGHIEWMR